MPLTEREAEIMGLLWDHGRLTVNEALDLMEAAPPYTSVLSIFQTLRDKGLVGYTRDGRAYRHHPNISRWDALYDALEWLDEHYCSGPDDLLDVASSYLGRSVEP